MFGDGKTSTFQGKNGDKVKVNLDVDRNAMPGDGASRNGVVVTFVSEKSGIAKRYMPVMIALE